MNTQPSPLVPQGSLLDQKNQGRARVKIAILVVLAVHGIGLMALLMAGCQKEPAGTTGSEATATNESPAFAAVPPVADTNTTSNYVPPPPLTNDIVPAIQPSTNAVPTAGATEYTVVKGDSFYTIAKKLGVSQAALVQANPKIEPTKLQPGMKLVVPAPTVAGGSTTTTRPIATNGTELYSVKSNDTLSKIATQYHTTVKAIQSANNLTTTRITVGQKLKIPVKSNTTAGSTNTDPAPTGQ